jgi:LysM repeat protein
MVIFLGLNVLVSASVTLLVLSLWDAGRSPARVIPTLAPTAIAVVSAPSQEAAPTPTSARPTPAAAPHTYVVQAGDTLSAIARNFNVALADLLAANNLKDGDLLSIGQTLIIPSSNGSTPLAVTPSLTPIKPQPVVTQSIALGDAFVTIREIVSSGQLADEAVILTNLGNKINLKDWTLADGEGHKFSFPDLTLLPNAEVKVHTATGANTATDLYWRQLIALWGGTGTVAYLRDPDGKLIATYRVP